MSMIDKMMGKLGYVRKQRCLDYYKLGKTNMKEIVKQSIEIDWRKYRGCLMVYFKLDDDSILSLVRPNPKTKHSEVRYLSDVKFKLN